MSGTAPPKPFRGLKKGGATKADDSEEEDDEEEEDDDGAPAAAGGAMEDLIPRVDISSKITDGLLAELSDSKWKVRGEAIEKVSNLTII